MTKIPEEYTLGSFKDLEKEELLRVLQDMYRILATAVNMKPDIIVRQDSSGNYLDGSTSDVRQSIGDININPTTGKVEFLTNHTNPQTVVWTTV